MGTIKIIDLEDSCECAEGSLRLTITIGDGNIGASVVKVGGVIVATGEVTNQLLGQAALLKGQDLQIKTLVTDVRPQTNRTSVTYALVAGEEEHDFLSTGDVDVDGDSIVHRALIHLA